MKNIWLIISACLFLTSCATILKKEDYDLRVTSNVRNAKVKVYDSLYDLPNNIKVVRSKKDLKLTLISDTLNLDYIVKSSPNPTFLYLNSLGMQLSPAYYAIDLTNQKRFYYGDNVYLNTNDTTRIIHPPVRKFWNEYFGKKYPKNKEHINLSLSIPYINGFNFEPNEIGTKVNTGFWGISAGLEYFYRDDKYVALKFVAATDFFVPIPAAATLDDVREDLSTTYIDLTDNYKLGRLNFGYGINYSVNNYRLIDQTYPDENIEFRRKNQSFGLTANTYFQFGKSLFAGVVYRPTFIRINPTIDFKYEHLISVDFAFKIPMRKNNYG
ncbi:hypothetical protein [Nonlabens agnitus]|uniref:Uncharacterized protein n=1 Tax=Nonlabens agnitus TaxID=870484 RepID=A0A2S9WUJ3_9FLAO|nr:hypothetical protein [Nonlabens agnitus]PRP67144.1 hypothetical protein BST86_08560 [Nonlabens agnitus]